MILFFFLPVHRLFLITHHCVCFLSHHTSSISSQHSPCNGTCGDLQWLPHTGEDHTQLVSDSSPFPDCPHPVFFLCPCISWLSWWDFTLIARVCTALYSSKAFVSTHALGNILKHADVLGVVRAAQGSKLRLRPERHQRKRDCGPKEFAIHDSSFC